MKIKNPHFKLTVWRGYYYALSSASWLECRLYAGFLNLWIFWKYWKNCWQRAIICYLHCTWTFHLQSICNSPVPHRVIYSIFCFLIDCLSISTKNAVLFERYCWQWRSDTVGLIWKQRQVCIHSPDYSHLHSKYHREVL